jgi:hypothetical protein
MEKKCEHVWIPEGFTLDTEVYGTGEEYADLADRFAVVRCEECGLTGYVWLK